MKNLEIKKINFEGGEILGVKTKEGKIYMGIKKACQDIGLTENQAKRQIKNCKDDVVLSKGYKELRVKFDTQARLTSFMELDFVPLWLAKISITPAMQKKNPKAVDKLVTYQLKAQKALAEAFVGSEEKITEFNQELGLSGEIIELKEEIIKLENTVKTLIDNSTINSHQASKLNKLARQRIKELLGGTKSEEYKKYSRKYFKQLWLNVCDKFNVTTYKDLNPIHVPNAVEFIKGWSYISQ
jgi:hypothetical protein